MERPVPQSPRLSIFEAKIVGEHQTLPASPEQRLNEAIFGNRNLDRQSEQTITFLEQQLLLNRISQAREVLARKGHCIIHQNDAAESVESELLRFSEAQYYYDYSSGSFITSGFSPDISSSSISKNQKVFQLEHEDDKVEVTFFENSRFDLVLDFSAKGLSPYIIRALPLNQMSTDEYALMQDYLLAFLRQESPEILDRVTLSEEKARMLAHATDQQTVIHRLRDGIRRGNTKQTILLGEDNKGKPRSRRVTSNLLYTLEQMLRKTTKRISPEFREDLP